MVSFWGDFFYVYKDLKFVFLIIRENLLYKVCNVMSFSIENNMCSFVVKICFW